MENDGATTETAAAQLAALQEGREQVAPRARQPWWYDHHWVLLPAGGVLAIAIALVSRWWTTIYIAELTKRP